ncbi:hypothetical protein [Streptomyces sudanensis]|uniref:hypothetical protein n=1 Tax=Streptomyces sudanensis TaxID=436397 RepID=UPI0020CF30B0|nr:hypothetical protein [Streptomyces sudanensis]MCP9999425.1 hypothetical protein [Streptomyces sudanensis]
MEGGRPTGAAGSFGGVPPEGAAGEVWIKGCCRTCAPASTWPPEGAAGEPLLEGLLPYLRTGFRLAARSGYREDVPPAVPVTFLNGTDGSHIERVGPGHRPRGCVGEPQRRGATGGRFCFEDDPDPVTPLLGPLVVGGARRGRGHRRGPPC